MLCVEICLLDAHLESFTGFRHSGYLSTNRFPDEGIYICAVLWSLKMAAHLRLVLKIRVIYDLNIISMDGLLRR